jgi:hypothetical protein
MTFCGNCGGKIEDGVKFCNNCGNPVTVNVTQNTSTGDYKSSGAGSFAKDKFANVAKTDWKSKGNQLSENPLFNFLKPYFNFLEKGKLLGLIYYLMAGLNLLLPFAVFFNIISSGIFRMGFNYILAFITSWAVIVVACLVGFLLWWERRKRITAVEDLQFVATVAFSEILQTLGEWLGTFIGIVGVGVGLFGTVFLGNGSGALFSLIGLGFLSQFGIATVAIGPVTGFFIIVFTRFLAEQVRLITSLVNNTKEIAINCKELAVNKKNSANDN